MPAPSVITIKESDFGSGIDAQSSPNQVGPGFVEDAINADPQPTGTILKRKGYQGHAGYVPLRVKGVSSSGTALTIELDPIVDLLSVRSTPVILYGRAPSSTGGDLSSTDSYHWYPSFSADARHLWAASSSGTTTLTAADTGLSSINVWTGVGLSTSEANPSHQHISGNSIVINGSYQLDVSWTNGTTADKKVFIYYKDQSTVAGDSYIRPVQTYAAGTHTVSIAAGTHGLTTNNILARAFSQSGGSNTEVAVDAIVINASGQVDVTFTVAASTDIVIMLARCPAGNYQTGVVGANSTSQVVCNLDASTQFAFVGVYLNSGGSSVSQVLPDAVEVDTVAHTMTISFTNGNPTAANFSIYWQEVTLTVNKLTVTQGSGATYVDNSPQLTLYGLDHSYLYSATSASFPGWVTYLDTYRSVGEERLVCGMEGNFLTEGNVATSSFTAPVLYPFLSGILASDTIIGPVFWDTGDTPALTRGYITGDTAGTNQVSVASVAWVSGNTVKYTLDIPNMAVSGTLSSIIRTGNIPDYLTVENTSWSVHNGTFRITAVVAGVDSLVVSVTNANVSTNDYDIAGAGGLAGIFTDQATLSSTSLFLTGDRVRSDVWDETDLLSCYARHNSAATSLALDGVVSRLSLPAGLRFVGEREAAVVPLRDLSFTASVSHLVAGDQLSYTGIDRTLRVKFLNELGDTACTIAAGDGEQALVTLSSGDTTSLWEGERLLFRGNYYQGDYEIASIEDATSFYISTTLTTVDTATIVGKTVHVDEVLDWQDTVLSTSGFEVPLRWFPIEAPDDSYSLTDPSHYRYLTALDVGEQLPVRSVMVKDSLFITNQYDSVLKYDGESLYHAGIPSWQPGLFVDVNTSASAKIIVASPSAAVTAVTSNRFTLTTAADKNVFAVDSVIQHSGDSALYTVTKVEEINSVSYVYVDRTITSGTPGTITIANRFRYYFRVQAVDANNNIVATAATGLEDFTVALGADAAVQLKLTGLPVFGIRDWDRLEVSIFRSKANTFSVFYQLATLPLSFSGASDGYILFTDTFSDSELSNLDPLSTVVSGDTILTTLDKPLRAKYVTSAGNRLVLAGLKSEPTIDWLVTKNQAVVTAANMNAVKVIFRKDNTNTATVTDNDNVQVYQFRDVGGYILTSSVVDSGSGVYTVTLVAAHGASTGDWVFMGQYTAGTTVDLVGWYRITVTGATTFTFTASASGLTTTSVNAAMFSGDPTDIPVVVGQEYSYGQLNGNRASGANFLFLAMLRLAGAINAVQRQLGGGWMSAKAGNLYQAGELIVEFPGVYDTTPEIVTGNFSSFSILVNQFVNKVKKGDAVEANARTNLYPSRVLVSLENFPEMFDAPTALSDLDSASAIDVNSADGQDITAVIPFFGDSAFGAAQKSGVLVVFKSNSIYLVDVAAKDAGQPAVQKVESQGKGCTYPYSVAVTRDGIMFANDSGIYRLNRQLGIDYIGRRLQSKWTSQVNTDGYSLLGQGHHDAVSNSYKFSFVPVDETSPSEVFVYNHTREYQSQSGQDGSWARYTNQPAIGWANLTGQTYFASPLGRVFQVRRVGDVTDFRDDDQAVEMTIVTRGQDFGDAGIRKVVRAINAHFTGAASSGTTLDVATDLTDVYENTDSFRIKARENEQSALYKIYTVQFTLNKTKAIYFQVRLQNSTIDEQVELTALDWRVSGLTERGIRQAASTMITTQEP